ncbi:MAG TPA: OmpA family protein [Planctomycetota bacterium]|nr:OmpA family protein [Planctomycetota bacterium]
MTPRSILCRLTAPLLLVVTGCTTTYQQMLHERDLKITQLENANAQLRAANRELERREKTSREEAQALRDRLTTQPTAAEAAAKSSELQQVQDELKDLDVGYRRGHVSIGIENEVTFASGSTELKPGAGKVLERVASVLKRRFPDRRIYVEGHTDSDPIQKTKGRFRSNLHLSAERADAVANYLIEKCGLPADRVVIAAYGPHDPKAPGTSEAAKAKNRRVEIVVGEPK